MQRDLTRDRLRTVLAVLSIAVGVSAVGMVSGASEVMTSTLDQAYRDDRAASATFTVSTFPASVIADVMQVEGVANAAGAHSLTVRLEASGQWRNLTITALPDYGHIAINRFYPERGAWPPPDGELLFERSSLAFLGARTGGDVLLELADGQQMAIRVAGTVHDLNYPSARATGLLNAYVSFATLALLGERSDLNQLLIVTAPGYRTKDAVGQVAAAVRARLDGEGYAVLADSVPTPGLFWADDQINATVLLLDVMAVVSFLISGFLVANIISALVTRQVRDIGVMKAVGASPGQVARLYLGSVGVYALLALVIGVPVGAIGAVGIVDSTRDVLNFDPPGVRLYPQVLALQLVSALAVATGAALGPVVAAGRLTVREAIAGASRSTSARQLFDRIPGLSTPVRLSAANALRHRGRAALTLLALVLAGTAFEAVVSVRSSVDRTLADAVATRGYDVQLSLSRPMPATQAVELAEGVPGVQAVEPWTVTAGFRIRADGSEGASIVVIAPPSGSTLISPVMVSGRWLSRGDHELVINSDLVAAEPGLGTGRDVILEIGKRQIPWHVVGEARGSLSGPIAYARREEVETLLGSTGSAAVLAVTGARHDAAGQAALARALELDFKGHGHPVAAADTTDQWRDFLAADYGIATNFLLGMAAMLAAVGGLSLAGILSINVLERTREIGVMRALGASDAAVRMLVVGEALAMAVLAWLLAAPLSPLASGLLSDAFGLAFLHLPLSFAYGWSGLGLWAAVVVVLSAVSSLLPAWNASRLTIRETLAYE